MACAPWRAGCAVNHVEDSFYSETLLTETFNLILRVVMKLEEYADYFSLLVVN